ncbi:hypothetical protein Ae201684_005463 [Aphanomyces euteiches]|uniref:Protein kinase domain-containing protein n=1 Tax=Aphanomyces euteiches TaxID=100861 RepID=A0A6G0XF19_9STRA|nr:hypothetical protein Ae201684_005463 [Aphanomyces euteiches]KAH9133645.1 hypothetical protein AeRB84_020307 [Aphanomyces euteiches]
MWIDLDLQIVGGVEDLMQDMHAMMDKLRRVEFYIGAAREGGGTLIRQIDSLVEMAIQLQRGLDFYHQNVSLRNVHVNATFEDSIRTSISRVVDAAKESWRAQKSPREMPLEDMIEDWMLASEDIEYDPTKQSTFLGRGATATVYLGKYKDRQVAVKHFHSMQIANSTELERMIRKEIKAWRDVANERYILTLIGVCTKIATPILVCEYCPYTITRYIYMHPDKLIEMVYQFTRGVKSMHDLGIIHRDLKGANVMVTDQGTVAIADFGLSRSTASVLTQNSAASKFVGTLNWMSPEQRFSPRKMTVQSDIWSFGMTVWELLCDEVPFRQWCQEEIECAIRSDDERPDRPEDLPRELERLWELITWCWKVDPLARPKAHEIVSFLELHYHNEVKAHAQDSLAMEAKTNNVLPSQDEIATSPMTKAMITPRQPPMMQSPDNFQSNPIPIHLVGASDPENNNRSPEIILNDPDLLALRIEDADVQCIRQISQSANEEMWIGHHHGSPVIIKRLLPHKSTLSNAISFAREIKVSSKLHHPKIVKFIGISFTTLTNIQAIFESMNRSDLKTLLKLKMKSGGSNPWRDIKIQWAIDIAEALDYLHGITPKHIHGGVNTRNIFIDDSSSLQGLTNGAKLFCLCMPRNYQQDEAESECRWIAPEVLRGEIYDEASDVWSFGCFLAELDTGFQPYNDVKDEGDIPLPDFAIALRISQEVFWTWPKDVWSFIHLVDGKCIKSYTPCKNYETQEKYVASEDREG